MVIVDPSAGKVKKFDKMDLSIQQIPVYFDFFRVKKFIFETINYHLTFYFDLLCLFISFVLGKLTIHNCFKSPWDLKD